MKTGNINNEEWETKRVGNTLIFKVKKNENGKQIRTISKHATEQTPTK